MKDKQHGWKLPNIPQKSYEGTNILQDRKVSGGHYYNINHHIISSRRQERVQGARDVYYQRRHYEETQLSRIIFFWGLAELKF